MSCALPLYAGSLKYKRCSHLNLPVQGQQICYGTSGDAAYLMPDTTMLSSSEIRQIKRQQRRSLSDREQEAHAKALAGQLSRFVPFRYSKRLAFYLANDGEIDPSFIINYAWNMGKRLHLPVLSPLKNQLYFSPYKPDTVMRANRFDIEEPACHPRQWLSAQQIDVLFLPLVAFDRQGNRIGMGGGFYDRFLARPQLRAKTVGITFGRQLLEELPVHSHDRRVQIIITDAGIYHCNQLSQT